MGILSWIVLGLIAGFIGSKIVNRQGQGFWLDVALGIEAGSALGSTPPIKARENYAPKPPISPNVKMPWKIRF
jgi:hypothetical protein